MHPLRYALLWSCLSSATVLGSAQAGLSYNFTPSFFHAGATGPSSGSLTLADGIGFGDTFQIADIDDFQFSHTFSPSATATFTTTDLTNLGGFTYQVAEDGQTVQGFIGSQITAVNTSDQRLRLALNATPGNDNYVVDNPATSSNGALGGAFGTFSLVTDPVSITGDYNADGFVSQGDLDLVLLNWGDTTAPAGFNENALAGGGPFDSLISQNELDGVLLNWGNGTPPVAAIPEPTSLLLILTPLLAANNRRRADTR